MIKVHEVRSIVPSVEAGAAVATESAAATSEEAATAAIGGVGSGTVPAGGPSAAVAFACKKRMWFGQKSSLPLDSV